MKSFPCLQGLNSAALPVVLFLCFAVVSPPNAKSAKSAVHKKTAAPAYTPAPASNYLDDIINGKQSADPEPAVTEPPPSEPAPSEPIATEPVPAEPAAAEPAPSEPVATEPAPAPEPAPSGNVIDNSLLTNIVFTEKGIKAFGWGEYQVGGRCLCCDNFLDGDCIVVHSTNRTEKIRIKQIIDGDIEADTSDKSTYFGDVVERERPELVNMLMAEITLKKMRDIYRVIIYTIVDKDKKKNYLTNCELGYYDRFDRLQWVGKKESKWSDESITFELEKPIFTQDVILRVKGGNSKITDVALFGVNEKK